MFKICPTISPKYPVFGYILVFLFVSNLYGQTTTVNWGTHKGPASPLHETFPTANWATNPNSIQKLLDITGTNLVGTTGYPDISEAGTNWGRGDRIELGFYASSLGADDDPGGGDDTPSTNMFEGTWIALTSETYIGQDWDGSTAVAAGEFAFESDFTNGQSYVVHQQGETYEIGSWPNDTSDYVDDDHTDKVFGSSFTYDIKDVRGDLTSGTKLGIRFYDNTNREDVGNVVRYNTVMNNDWTWGSPNLYLHDPDNPDNLDPGNVFEFDNSSLAEI